MPYCPLRSPFSASKRLFWQHRQIPECDGRLQTVEFQAGRVFDTGERFDPFAESEVRKAYRRVV